MLRSYLLFLQGRVKSDIFYVFFVQSTENKRKMKGVTCLLDTFRLNLVSEVCQSVLLFGAGIEVRCDVEIYFHSFLAFALDGGEWSASRHVYPIPGERACGTH